MSRRPTIADLADASGVSVSTVNRILGGSQRVRHTTVQRVRDVAERIGFYGLGTIEARKQTLRKQYRLGFLLPQPHRELLREFGNGIVEAAGRRSDIVARPQVEYVDELVPETIASKLEALGADVDAVALMAEDHPLIGQAIAALRSKHKPVITFITDQSAPARTGYVGTDNWRLGRTAAWFLTHLSRRPGYILALIGNHRYQCQDIADASFRSFFREHAPDQRVAETLPTYEDAGNAYRIVKSLLEEDKNLAGIFVGGGGTSGVLQALRDVDPGVREGVRVVCRDIGSASRRGLTEGLISAALCHPLARTSDELIETMISAIGHEQNAPIVQRIVPFDVMIPETA